VNSSESNFRQAVDEGIARMQARRRAEQKLAEDRTVASLWWLEQTGSEIPELTDDGELLSLHRLHRQTAPIVPRKAT
jgi:hypothetical protein